HAAADCFERHRLGHQSRDWIRDFRRTVARPSLDVARDPGGLFAARRLVSHPSVQAERETGRADQRSGRSRSVISSTGAMMRKTLSAFIVVALSSPALAQTTPPASSIRLTVDQAVNLALDHNPDLAAARFDPQIGDTRVAAASGAFSPTLGSSFGRNNQLQAPASLLVPTATRTDVVSSNISLNQRLPMFGTSYSLGWDGSHTTSNNFLNSYNPILRSGFSFNVSQPLLKDFKTDSARTQLVQSHYTRDVADAGLREQIVQTSASVKSTYWALVSANALVEARQTALDLAEEL